MPDSITKLLQYPKNNANIKMGDPNKTKDALDKGGIVIFTPRVIDYGKLDFSKWENTIETIKRTVKESPKVLNFSEDGFDHILSNGASNNICLKIQLPLKPIDIGLTHNWSMEKTFQANLVGKGITGATKAAGEIIGRNIINKLTGAVDESIGQNLADTILSQAGIYQYTPERQYYSGTEPIGLSFKWTFSPENENEALEIKKIIKSFQFLSTTQSPESVANSALYLGKNPAIWGIKILSFSKGAEIEFSKIFQNLITKNNEFPHMVCKSVSTSLGDGNFWASFEDGFPNTIDLSLSFEQFYSIQSASAQFGYESIDEILEKG